MLEIITRQKKICLHFDEKSSFMVEWNMLQNRIEVGVNDIIIDFEPDDFVRMVRGYDINEAETRLGNVIHNYIEEYKDSRKTKDDE